jgi:hypothetical protein
MTDVARAGKSRKGLLEHGRSVPAHFVDPFSRLSSS